MKYFWQSFWKFQHDPIRFSGLLSMTKNKLLAFVGCSFVSIRVTYRSVLKSLSVNTGSTGHLGVFMCFNNRVTFIHVNVWLKPQIYFAYLFIYFIFGFSCLLELSGMYTSTHTNQKRTLSLLWCCTSFSFIIVCF